MATIIPAVLSPRQLAGEVRKRAAEPREWMSRVRLSPDERWYERLHADDQYEVWLISWLPGQGTGFHDHGGSAGAFGAVWGTLEEHQAGTKARAVGRLHPVTARPVSAGQVHAFGPEYIHDVRNTSEAVAVSVHAYSPPLKEMTRYDLTGAGRSYSTPKPRPSGEPPGDRRGRHRRAPTGPTESGAPAPGARPPGAGQSTRSSRPHERACAC